MLKMADTRFNSILKYVLGILAALVGIYLIWYFRTIFLYVIIAAALTIICGPLVRLFKQIRIGKRTIPSWLAALLTLVVILGVGVGFFMLMIPLVSSKLSELSGVDINGMVKSLEAPLASFEHFLHEYFAINVSEESIVENVGRHLAEFFDMNDISKVLSSIVSVVANFVMLAFSVLFIAFFFLKDDKLFVNMLLAITPNRLEQNVRHAMSSISNLLSRYLIGILCESLSMMILVAVPLIICGYPVSTAFFIGIIIGLLNVIPYLGPWIGFAISFLIGIALVSAQMSLGFIFFSIAITVLCAQVIDNLLLQPFLYSNSVKAHPLEIFLVILMAGKVGGVFGMIVAIPAYTVLRVIAKEFFNHLKVVQKLTRNL